MEIKGKLALIEEIMDMDDGTLKPDTQLDNLDCWDSLARLSLIVMMDDNFGKTLNGEQVRDLKTVQEILELME